MKKQTVPEPFSSGRAHLDALFERVRLLLARHIVQRWYRLTDSIGNINTLCVSLDEVRRALRSDPSAAPPSDSAQLPSLKSIEANLKSHADLVQKRVAASHLANIPLPLEVLRARFSLDGPSFDLILLLAALQLDLGLHRLASFAWADFSIKQPTLGFAAEVISPSQTALRDQVRLCASPNHPLFCLHILEFIHDERWGSDTPELFLRVRLPPRIIAFLLQRPSPLAHMSSGESPQEYDSLDLYCRLISSPSSLLSLGQPPDLHDHFARANAAAQTLTSHRSSHLASHLASLPPVISARVAVISLVGSPNSDHASIVAACTPHPPTLAIDFASISPSQPESTPLNRERAETLLARALREAKLLNATPVILFDDLFNRIQNPDPILATLTRLLPLMAGGLVVLSMHDMPARLRKTLGPCAIITISPPPPPARAHLWRAALNTVGAQARSESTLDELANRYPISALDIYESARNAAFDAALSSPESPHVNAAQLHRAVRERVAHKLGILAEPVSSSLSWDNVILSPELRSRLQEMVTFGRNERRVFDDWGFGRLHTYGRGLTALFSGPPGTGKTLCASIIAREIGLQAYRVDLSRVVDKYIGETEKNLARVFDEAERSNALLLFDEADSLFAKRTGVKSSNDRYANLEVNFLLQRMEHFNGVSILTTNLAEEIDDAFLRRIKFRLSFSLPAESERIHLWQLMIPHEAPLLQPIDWETLARDYEMAPGHIKNAILRAAFQAAQLDIPISSTLLYESARIEYRELGNLVKDD